MTAVWSGFRSPLGGHIERYLVTKRALGCRFHSEDRTLRVFDRFLDEAGVATIEQITDEMIDRFLASRPRRAPKSYNHLLGVVRRLCDWLVSQEVIAASPVHASARRETARRLPFLFTPPLARRLLDVARALPDNNRSRYRGQSC
jgi:site-specific recombinase XerD